MALITQANLEQHLQVTFGNDPDPVVAQYIAQAQAVAESYCGQLLEEQAGVVEEFEVDQWDPWYRLAAFPVSAVASVVVDGTALTADEFRFYEDGRIRRLSDSRDVSWSTLVAQNVVTFTHGFGTAIATPDDLVLGITIIAAELFRHGAQFAATGTAGPVQSISLDGSDSITYMASPALLVSDGGLFVPAASQQLLAKYRRRKM